VCSNDERRRHESPAGIARDGYDKPAIKQFLFEHARFPPGGSGMNTGGSR
jgi:hypothetical protein